MTLSANEDLELRKFAVDQAVTLTGTTTFGVDSAEVVNIARELYAFLHPDTAPRPASQPES